MLLKFKEIFGDDLINNVAFVFTHWSNNKRE